MSQLSNQLSLNQLNVPLQKFRIFLLNGLSSNQEEECQGHNVTRESHTQDAEECFHQEILGVEHHLVGAAVTAGIPDV